MRHKPEFEVLALLPGTHLIGGAGCRMRTLLGPGVVITLWHRARRIGAMAHFLPAAGDSGIPLELDGRIGPDGLQAMLEELQWSQEETAAWDARICGGGTVKSRIDRVPSLNTGQTNGEFARRMLRGYGLPIISERFYALGRQQIIFDAGSGRMQARRIKPVVVALEATSPPVTAQVMTIGGRRSGAAGG